ncbi:MAG: sugar phosphate isomerase/epimerase [Armatimonadetes bacterium]|nr:sugar phosphate isomerase/epimerase [Armatimonadota bacterium]
MYRVGYRTASFSEWPLERALAALGKLGFDSIELCLEREDLRPTTLSRRTAASVVDAVECAGLRIHSVSFHGDGMNWPERAQEQKAAVASARWFGARVVVVNTPRCDEGVDPQEVNAHIGDLVEVAKHNGVLVAVEPEPGLIVSDVADALRLVDHMQSEFLGVNLDIGHAFLTEVDVAHAARALQGRIFHTHVEDISDDVHRHLVPGEGEIDLPKVFCALWEAGYRGTLTIDLFGPYDDPVRIARAALRATRDALRRAMASARPHA